MQNTITIKQMEHTKKGLEARLAKLRADHKKDDVVTFEQLGVSEMDKANAEIIPPPG